MKWAYLYRSDLDLRYELLSKELATQGIENQFEALKINQMDLLEQFDDITKKYDQLRCDSIFTDIFFSKLTKNKKTLEDIRSVDCLIKTGNESWADCCLFDGVQKFIVSSSIRFDSRGEALVIGTSPLSRMMCVILIKLGYKKINLSSMFEEQGDDLIKSLSSLYFGVDFQFISPDQLIMLPGTNTVLVNTLKVSEVTELLYNELYYFNFLTKGAVVWDMYFSVENSVLIDEAKKLEVQTYSALKATVASDELWLARIGCPQLNLTGYFDKILKLMK
ncbi:MAG: hypothetical protein HOO06_01565 [Bdellovibrionaceae bacterium]|jgi:shikimate 5-dehydrogenase|nr:hypothetical protein [Pseudobdellovibrionaceae bacterium]